MLSLKQGEIRQSLVYKGALFLESHVLIFRTDNCSANDMLRRFTTCSIFTVTSSSVLKINYGIYHNV